MARIPTLASPGAFSYATVSRREFWGHAGCAGPHRAEQD